MCSMAPSNVPALAERAGVQLVHNRVVRATGRATPGRSSEGGVVDGARGAVDAVRLPGGARVGPRARPPSSTNV